MSVCISGNFGSRFWCRLSTRTEPKTGWKPNIYQLTSSPQSASPELSLKATAAPRSLLHSQNNRSRTRSHPPPACTTTPPFAGCRRPAHWRPHPPPKRRPHPRSSRQPSAMMLSLRTTSLVRILKSELWYSIILFDIELASLLVSSRYDTQFAIWVGIV